MDLNAPGRSAGGQFAGVQLGLGRGVGKRRAAVPLPGGPVHQQPGRVQLRGRVRQHVLHRLKLEQGRTELSTLSSVLHGGVQASLGDPQRLRRDSDPAHIQGLERHPDPVPGTSQEVFTGNQAFTHNQGGYGVRAHAAHVLQRPHGKPFHPPLHHKEAEPPFPVLGIRARQHHGQVGHGPVGHENFVGIQPIVPVFLQDSRGLDGGDIRSGIGLGETEGADPVAGTHARQETTLLLRIAEGFDGEQGNTVVHRDGQCHAGTDTAELLDDDHVAHRVQARTSPFRGGLQTEQVHGLHRLHEFPGETGLLVQFVGHGCEPVLGKIPDRPADHFLFAADLKIQDRPRENCYSLFPKSSSNATTSGRMQSWNVIGTPWKSSNM